MTRIFITGSTGFVGSHMIDYLLDTLPDVQIYAIKRWRSASDNIRHLLTHPNVHFIEGDLLDRSSLQQALKLAVPDYVLHFASQSFPETSFITPIATLNTNVIGTTNLFEELLALKKVSICDPVILSVSTSEVYGITKPEEVPIKETNPLRAANPYSISKVGHDLMSQYYFQAHGLKVIITRMFSHEGPRRGPMFALSSFARQITAHEKIYAPSGKSTINFDEYGEFCPIYVGNLDSIRTYAHIYDAVRAYWLACTKAMPGEAYNIGGYHTCRVGDALDALLAKSYIPRQNFKIVIDPSKIRPTDITLQIPDCTKFKLVTGWKQEKTFDDIISDMIADWRKRN